MKYLIKPVTKKMLTQLQAGRTIQLSDNGKGTCLLKDFNGSLSGLYRRGLVNTKLVMVEGKELVGVFITQAGLNLLKRCEEDENILNTLKQTG